MATTETTKPWYKSKIFLMSLSGLLFFGSNWLNGWLTGQGVTQDQLDAISSAQPAVADTIQKIQDGTNWLSAIGSVSSVLLMIFRAWFTNKAIA